ncbi:MAG: beta-lactamase family protein [Candidatus Hydrogenedentes bacterium]|nr:beta-lactamase family protein [Candidatus Hydrogenedentota bacterium]
MKTRILLLLAGATASLWAAQSHAQSAVFPGATWEKRTPEEAGLDTATLDTIRDFCQGRGCVVRHGCMVYAWGDVAQAGDVASAAKPWFAHFLLRAVESGKLKDMDVRASEFTTGLRDINPALGHKDASITFRHLVTQTSCYGVSEKPGDAFDYNDWQTALFFDTLFLKVYGATYDTVDEQVLHAGLTDALHCEDEPTFRVFGEDRVGRLGVSPRDFARFGHLYLHEGDWNGTRLLSREHARMAVTSPLPASLPRTSGVAADMLPGARTIGSQKIPDNQTDHGGSYSFMWWVNGVDRDGKRNWPDAPEDVFAALGHANGMRGMAVFPSQDIVMSWNDTVIDGMPEESNPLNRMFSLLSKAVKEK